jgi:6-phosphogluconolactonase
MAMNGEVRVVESVPDAFARLVADQLAAAGDDGYSLFLSGGDTAADCYRRLAELTGPNASPGPSAPVDWSRIDVYLGDERCVPPDDPDSNHRMITETLLDRVGPVRSDHPMYQSGSPEDAAADYQRLVAGLPALDLVHLGLGPDGHTASLFPDSAALGIDDPDILVSANRDPKANNPHDRITLTFPGIARARLVVFTVTDQSKRSPFQRIEAGENLPASRVTAEQIIWLVDTAVGGPDPQPG